MYSTNQTAGGIELVLDGSIVAHFYDANTAATVAALLNAERAESGHFRRLADRAVAQ